MDNLSWTALIGIVAYLAYKACRKKNFFNDYGIPCPFEIPYLGITIKYLFYGRHINYFIREVYDISSEAKYVGCHMFYERIVILRDPELIKNVVVKNFDRFTDRRSIVDADNDPLVSRNLAFLNGDRWREVRSLMSPAFTSSKMRAMYKLMWKCGENFAREFMRMNRDKDAVDIKDAFTRYANDVIATCAFGVGVDSMRDPTNEFYTQAKKSLNLTVTKLIAFKFLSRIPFLMKKFDLRLIPKESTDFFVNLVKSTIDHRVKSGISRPDMLQLMMEARGKENQLDIIEMAAQAFVFFLGGFETTSSQMCMMAQELAMNPEVQERLLAEIDEVMERTDGKPTYEANNDMPYLDAVFNETMRLHPMGNVGRVCSKDFELPPALPGAKPYVVRVDDEVFIPIAGIHRDPRYYEDPDRFDPERFVSAKKKSASNDMMNIGFGLGQRACIGGRFAILETKVLFVHLLRRCSFKVCEKTCIPLEYDKSCLSPAPKGGTWLRISSRN